MRLPSIESPLLTELSFDDVRTGPDGQSVLYGTGAASIRLFLTNEACSGMPVAAIVPLGPDGIDRIGAVMRLWRAVNMRRVPPDSRVTAQQRHRLRRMLQAVDGHAEGASYRDIAEAIFGPARISETPWKTSALRDVTIDLVKDGLALIAGGYRKLLLKRRRR